MLSILANEELDEVYGLFNIPGERFLDILDSGGKDIWPTKGFTSGRTEKVYLTRARNENKTVSGSHQSHQHLINIFVKANIFQRDSKVAENLCYHIGLSKPT